MNVRELQAILAHVDPELEVYIGAGEKIVTHIEDADLRPKDNEWKPGLTLRGTTVWTDDAPPFTVEGRFRRAGALEDELRGLRGK